MSVAKREFSRHHLFFGPRGEGTYWRKCRTRTPVLLGGMTTGTATAAMGVLLEIDGHGPVAALERHCGSHVPWQVAAMNLMAGSAGPPLVGTVHVEEVEIPLSVAEVGQGGGFLLQHDRAAMAIEA